MKNKLLVYPRVAGRRILTSVSPTERLSRLSYTSATKTFILSSSSVTL